MKNIGANSVIKPFTSCNESLLDDTFWSINEEEASLSTPTNITGYYMRMIEGYIKSFDDLSEILVKPAINKELEEDFADPVIVIQRGELTPSNVGIMNSESFDKSGIMPQGIFNEKHPDANFYDSTVHSEMVTMGLNISIYGLTTAEVEKISILLYNLLLAASYDVLRDSFEFILAINPPVLSPVGVSEKHSEIYTAQINWSLVYKDDAILLIRKNVIKYATIIVREKMEERKLSSFQYDNN